MSEHFHIEKPNEETKQNYKEHILQIIDEVENTLTESLNARLVYPDKAMDKETHEKRVMDAKNERKELEEVRNDICDSFRVPKDPEHVYIEEDYNPEVVGLKKQRAHRAFVVLIDILKKQRYYGEGRTDHNKLLTGTIALLNQLEASEGNETISPDQMFDELAEENPKFMVLKGFLAKKDFSSFSKETRSVLETPILDKEGNVIETPSTWFLSGHSIQRYL